MSQYIIRQVVEGGQKGSYKIVDKTSGEVVEDGFPDQAAAADRKKELDAQNS